LSAAALDYDGPASWAQLGGGAFRPPVYPSASALDAAFRPLFGARSRPVPAAAAAVTPVDLWSRRLRELAGQRSLDGDTDRGGALAAAFGEPPAPHECPVCRKRFRFGGGLAAHYYEAHGLPLRPSPLVVVPSSFRDPDSPPPPPLPPRRRRPRDDPAAERTSPPARRQRHDRERLSDVDADDEHPPSSSAR